MSEVWGLLMNTHEAVPWLVTGLVLLGWQILFVLVAVLSLAMWFVLLVLSPVGRSAGRAAHRRQNRQKKREEELRVHESFGAAVSFRSAHPSAQ